ncbi:D-ribose pyranase [Robbsia andropogonis]|uniref:D-ribose pyranase n=1 Tax=Robbsia andropogonis TaxID=28092 RepID=UPI00209FE189|nr:D-ribose pyranase [Robbsia andropogonis]MCP1117691.1 D-ribose pyranase [Robbsia andropogonis]MCP1127157.1 D-ribose pyranase [Robbsia andropogonis]
MKKTPLLHTALSRLIASLGHGDMVLIADAGMPAPRNTGVEIIDLALTPGMPCIDVVLSTVLTEMQVESYVIASETVTRADRWLADLQTALPIDHRTMSHAELKTLSGQARAFIRTGECTPYANVILVAGVTF